MSTATKEMERRRFIRHEIKLNATLSTERSVVVPCLILDFCTHGFFLEVTDSATDLASLLNQHVTVQFSATSETGNNHFEIDSEVVRICPNGIGLAFDKNSPAAFNALQNEALAQQNLTHRENPPRLKKKVDLKNFEKSSAQLLEQKMPWVLEAFFEQANEALLNAVQHAGSDKEQAEYLDATTNLKSKQPTISRVFCDLCVSGDTTGKEAPAEEPHGDGSLSLVDTNEFEDWLNLSSAIRKTETQFANQLDELGKKLSHIYNSSPEQINNPLSPEKLYANFRKAIEVGNDTNQIKQILYQAFDSILSKQLSDLYTQLDALLIENGAPAKIDREKPKRKQKPAPHSKNRAPNSSESDSRAEAREEVQLQKQPGTPPGSSNANQGEVSIPASAHQAHDSAPKPYHPKSLAETAGLLINLSRQANPAPGNNYANANEYSAQHDYSSEEILDAIAQLQHNLTELSSGNLNQKVLENLSRINSDDKKINTRDRNNLEISEKLFDTILKDPALTPGAKSQLESLQLPISALSLRDSNFLNEPTHPAHSVLNQLSYLGDTLTASGEAEGNAIKASIDKLVARITQESFDNPDVFAQIDRELAEISEPAIKSSETNIRRVVEACEGKQKMADAKQIVQSQIDNRIAGKSIAKIVSSLLETGWQHLLVITLLRDGENSKEWQQYLAIIDQLQSWLSTEEILSQQNDSDIQKLLDVVDNKLGTVCPDTFIYNKIIDELSDTLLGSGTPRIRKTAEMVDIAAAIPVKEYVDEIIDADSADQINRIRVGEWFMFSRKAEGLEPLKLVWINNTATNFVFVNRKGHKEFELSKLELAEKISSGIATKVESLDVPLMDRTTSRMLQKMHDRLMENAIHDPVTGLLNRKAFEKRLLREISAQDNFQHLLCYIEIRGIRFITSSCGLGADEQLLKKLTTVIQEVLGKNAIFAKLGDKTFAILFKHCSINKGQKIADNVLELIDKFRFKWNEDSYTVGINMGLVPDIKSWHSVDDLLQKANAICLSSTEAGHNQFHVYNNKDERQKAQMALNDWVGRIDQLFSDNRLFVRCQMIAPIDPAKNQHSHYEILLGVKDEEDNTVPPDDFIPAAERCQRMPDIDRWIVQTVLTWIEQHSAQFDLIDGFSINLSGQSLNSDKFLLFLKEKLSSSSIPHEKITFEITETVAAGDLDFAKTFIRQIKRFGCKFSLDDFGTGYSSYSYLKNLNVDYLKIDGVFVKDIASSEADVAMVRSMNEIGHSLGMETIAEYVENDEIKDILATIGVDYAQGWGVQKPVLLEELG